MRARLAAVAVTLLATLSTGLVAGTPAARADGDPGSDVLVYQPLFLASDAGISIPQQVRLAGLLQSAARAGFAVRVAIIAGPQDLGAVTSLWRKPQAYARFLGLEISLAYTGRLVVVMPNGFGFNWPGHPSTAAYRMLGGIRIGPGSANLAAAAGTAVGSLAAADGVKLRSVPEASSQTRSTPPAQAPSTVSPSPGSSTDTVVAIVAVVLLAAAGLTVLARRRLTRPSLRRVWARRPRSSIAVLAAVTPLAGAVVVALIAIGPPAPAPSEALATNPYLDPGTPLFRPAPAFTLTDQFARPVSLDSFRGKVVLLAFNDSECTTICPLTTTAMLDAKSMLGRAGANVQLLGIDANPKATSLEDVLSYSQLHGMLGAWHFLTGTLPELRRVWNAYGVQAAIQGGEITHTPALFVIDPQGRERKVYMTQQSYASIGQLGQLLAQEASRLMPGHPTVNSYLSYAKVNGIDPATPVVEPRSGGGTIRLGPGRPHLYLFFATWDRQVTGLAGGMEGLARYAALARQLGLPALRAVDAGSVEPAGALREFLSTLPGPLPYPIAVDRDGRLADGYEVESLPWLMVVSAKGQIAWYYSVPALGWPSTSRLIAKVKQALAYAAGPPASLVAAQAELSGSPPALAALHRQAGRLIGSQPALLSRIRSLHGYPVVINVWGSWCGPCVSEFGLFASASAHYGRQVAFLGADVGDSAGAAQAFMAQHPVSYPSYPTSTTGLDSIIPQGLLGTPTTIFLSPAGKLVYVHTGQYDSQGSLDGDIATYALRG